MARPRKTLSACLEAGEGQLCERTGKHPPSISELHASKYLMYVKNAQKKKNVDVFSFFNPKTSLVSPVCNLNLS